MSFATLTRDVLAIVRKHTGQDTAIGSGYISAPKVEELMYRAKCIQGIQQRRHGFAVKGALDALVDADYLERNGDVYRPK